MRREVAAAVVHVPAHDIAVVAVGEPAELENMSAEDMAAMQFLQDFSSAGGPAGEQPQLAWERLHAAADGGKAKGDAHASPQLPNLLAS